MIAGSALMESCPYADHPGCHREKFVREILFGTVGDERKDHHITGILQGLRDLHFFLPEKGHIPLLLKDWFISKFVDQNFS